MKDRAESEEIATRMTDNPLSILFRFPNLMGLVPPQAAAVEIIKAQRRNIKDISIPACWSYINAFLRYAAYRMRNVEPTS